MSRIEDALKILQRRAASPEPTPARSRTAQPANSAIPIANKKKMSPDGSKFHVSQEALIKGGLLAPLDQAIPVADEFRRIKRPLIANVVNAEPGSRMNVIMIASAMPGAGKTFCAVNLAVSMTLERELNVLLVDADVAKPHISRAFGLSDAPGLIDLLLDDNTDVADMLVRTDLNELQVLPAGRSHPHATELLASDRMTRIVSELASRYSDRIILLDSPPLLLTSEAQALANQVGQIAVVVEAGRTSHQMLTQTVDALDRNKAINLILNKSRYSGFGGIYGGEYEAYGSSGGT